MTFKTALRDGLYGAVGAAAGVFPFSVLTRSFYAERCPIVFYHAVWRKGDERLKPFGGVTLDEFERDLDRLAQIFEFAPLDAMLAASGAPVAGARPKVAITFDDGFDLIAGGAADALEARGARATAFVNDDSCRYRRLLWQHAFGVIREMKGEGAFLAAFNDAQRRRGLGADIAAFGDFIEATKAWPQRFIDPATDEIWAACAMPAMAAFLDRHRPYLDIEGLRAWRRRGHEVGFHGKSHHWSKALQPSEIEEQVVAPAQALKETLGLGRLAFAYPFGDRLSPGAERALWASGVFSCLLGTDRLARVGEQPFAIDRIEADFGLVRHFFGRPLIRALRKQDEAPAG